MSYLRKTLDELDAGLAEVGAGVAPAEDDDARRTRNEIGLLLRGSSGPNRNALDLAQARAAANSWRSGLSARERQAWLTHIDAVEDSDGHLCGEDVVGPGGPRAPMVQCTLDPGHGGWHAADWRRPGLERNHGVCPTCAKAHPVGTACRGRFAPQPCYCASLPEGSTCEPCAATKFQAHHDAARRSPGGATCAAVYTPPPVRPGGHDSFGPRAPSACALPDGHAGRHSNGEAGAAELRWVSLTDARRDASHPARRNPSGTTVRVGDLWASAYRIIGTPHVVFDCYEPARGYESHSSFRTVDGRNMGRVGTRRLPAEIDALPGPYTYGATDRGAARLAAVNRWHEGQYEECYRAICAAFPEACDGKRRSGEIEITDEALADRLDPSPRRR